MILPAEVPNGAVTFELPAVLADAAPEADDAPSVLTTAVKIVEEPTVDVISDESLEITEIIGTVDTGDDETRRGLAEPTMTLDPTVEVNVDAPSVMMGMVEAKAEGGCGNGGNPVEDDAAADDPAIVLGPGTSWAGLLTPLSAVPGFEVGLEGVDWESVG